MTRIDLSALSLQELKTLQKDVATAIATFADRHRQEALAAVQAKVQEMGFSLDELLETAPKPVKQASMAKYRHPENPALTWSGRGRQPAWIKEALLAGKTFEDLEI